MGGLYEVGCVVVVGVVFVCGNWVEYGVCWWFCVEVDVGVWLFVVW